MYFTEDKNLKIHRKINIIFRVFQVIAFLTVVSILIYSSYYGPSWGEVLLKKARPLEFHGRIDTIWYDKPNHNTPYAILSNGYRYAIDGTWDFLLKKGDSLSKDSGNLKIFVFRNDGKLDTLDYYKLAKGLDHDKNNMPRYRNLGDTTTHIIYEQAKP